jgi:hypothetical protein
LLIEYGDTAQDGILYVYTKLGAYPQKYKMDFVTKAGGKTIVNKRFWFGILVLGFIFTGLRV